MARNAGEITIDGNEMLTSIRLNVRMPRAFGLRMWIATRLFELAGWVNGFTVMIEVDGDDDEDDHPSEADVLADLMRQAAER